MEIYFKAKWKWHTVNRGEREDVLVLWIEPPPFGKSKGVCPEGEESEIWALSARKLTKEGRRCSGTLIIKINALAENYWNSGGREGRRSDWQTENGARRAEKMGKQAREVHISERTSLGVPTVEKWYPERKSPHNDVQLSGADRWGRAFRLAPDGTGEAQQRRKYENADNNWKLIWKFDFYWSAIWSLPLGREGSGKFIDWRQLKVFADGSRNGIPG